MTNEELIQKSLNEISELCKKADSRPSDQRAIMEISIEIKRLSETVYNAASSMSDIPDLSNFNALVVEDNNVNQMVAKAFLIKTGINVTIAENGADAIKIIEASESGEKFDIIFMDNMMPVMNGKEAIAELKKSESDYISNIPIVAMTGSTPEDNIDCFNSENICGFITKPITAKTLYDKCKEILNVNKTISCTFVENKEKNENIIKSTEESTPSISIYPNLSDKHILIVDDNKLNVEILNLMIKKTGAIFDDAFDGVEALKKFTESEENYYDLILMDIQMPNMDGNECAVKIRNSKRNDSSIPIIAISANAFKEDQEKSLKSGINYHMSKPVNMKKLHEKIRELLNIS